MDVEVKLRRKNDNPFALARYNFHKRNPQCKMEVHFTVIPPHNMSYIRSILPEIPLTDGLKSIIDGTRKFTRNGVESYRAFNHRIGFRFASYAAVNIYANVVHIVNVSNVQEALDLYRSIVGKKHHYSLLRTVTHSTDDDNFISTRRDFPNIKL